MPVEHAVSLISAMQIASTKPPAAVVLTVSAQTEVPTVPTNSDGSVSNAVTAKNRAYRESFQCL